jgi:tRNA threonylcarbamoyladenosine biosynthesis protein TsaB
MSKALAIETSGRIGSIATVQDGVVLSEESFPHGLQHAAQIIPIIDRLTHAQHWSARDIDCLYLSIGPGSFTGLRIAVTLAKTLAFTTCCKIIAVPTVRVLAENAPTDATNLIIVLDAKRGEIFTARFAHAANSSDWHEEEPARLDTLSAMLARSRKPVHLLGEGVPYHKDSIPNNSDIIITPEETWRARASAVAKIARPTELANQFADPLTLTPLYIRRPEAEEKWATLHSANDK